MKKMTKLIAVVLAAVMAMVMCVLPACASEMEDKAFSVESGKTYKMDYENGTAWSKFKVGKKGTVKIKVKLECGGSELFIYDEDGKKVWGELAYWDSKSKLAAKEWKTDLDSGIYYFGIKNAYNYTYLDKGKVTITYPSGSSSSADSSSDITIKITMDEGDKISLGALVSGKEKTVTWTSSKSSVVKVSSKGRVTAVKEGTATLTAKSGGKVIAKVIVEVE